MADPVAPVEQVVVASPVVDVAPAPAPAPVVEAAPAPAPVPVPEAVVVAEPVREALPTEVPTLLEQFDKDNATKVEEKPAVEGEKPADAVVEVKPEGEQPKVEEAKPAEVPVEAQPVEPEPIKFEYKLPENVVLPEKQQSELNDAFTNFARNPGSAEAQQKLIDFHVDRINEIAQAKDREQHQTFADVRNRWVDEVKSHPRLGGGNHAAAMQAIAYVRDNFVSLEPRGTKAYEAAKQKFDEFLHYTGAGDNPYFLDFVHNVSTVLNEGQPTAMTEVKLIPEQSANGGLAPIYRHHTSHRNSR